MLNAGDVIDHFRILNQIGRGGNAVVYAAKDLKLGRQVALKVFAQERLRSTQGHRQLLQEARNTAKLNHPHIVTIFQVGEARGLTYIALELLRGQTLRQRCAQQRPGQRAALRFLQTITQALAEAHRLQILHRDLKPENIYLPLDGRLRVLDFGLATVLDQADGQSSEPSWSGTPQYMAPEQWRGETAGKATDIWALGIIAYELLSGQRPYQSIERSKKTEHLKQQVLSAEPVPPLDPKQVPLGALNLVQSCLDKDPLQRPSAQAVLVQLNQMLLQQPTDTQRNPFLGLVAFTEKEADRYFGREAEVAQFLEDLRHSCVLPVVGPSGSGKSSFVQSGVIPRLREQGAQITIVVRPGNQPFAALAAALLSDELAMDLQALSTLDALQQTGQEQAVAQMPQLQRQQALAQRLQQSPGALYLLLLEIAQKHSSGVLLFVDQLEELATLGSDRDTQRDYMRMLCRAADDTAAEVRVVLALRDDFLVQLATTQEVATALGQMTLLRPPAAPALEQALRRPLSALGYSLDDDVVADIVQQVEGELACLPLLQFAASQLWQQRNQKLRLIDRSAYETIQGVAGALAFYADSILQGLTADQTALAQKLLLRLVTPQNTRLPVLRQDLLEGLAGDAASVLDQLVAARLIVIHRDHRGTVMELAHESLVTQWRTLARWIEHSRQELLILQDARQAAELWHRHGRPKGQVWQGDTLKQATDHLGRGQLQLPTLVSQFLRAGQKRQRAKVFLRRIAAGTVIAGLLLVSGIAITVAAVISDKEQLAVREKQRAEIRQAEAQWEGANAALTKTDMLQARSKLRSSLETRDTVEARAIFWALQHNPLLLKRDLPGMLNALALAPDGKQIAVATTNATIFLIDTATQKITHLRGHDDQVIGLAFCHGGRGLLAATKGGQLGLWDLQQQTVTMLPSSTPSIDYLVSNRSANIFIAMDLENTAHQIVLPSGRQTRIPLESKAAGSVTADEAGKRLALVDTENHFVLWDIEQQKTLLRKALPEATPLSHVLQFSPDGTTVAMGRSDRDIWLINGKTGAVTKVLKGHSQTVRDLVFSSRGDWLVSVGTDSIVRLWDLKSGEATTLPRHPGYLLELDISHDDQHIVTATDDGVVRFYSTAGIRNRPKQKRQAGHTGTIYGVAIHPEGKQLASGGTDGTVRLWDTETGQQLELLQQGRFEMWSVEYSPDGKFLATAGSNQRVIVWDLASRSLVSVLNGHSRGIVDVDFSNSGKLLASAGSDHTVRLWDLRDNTCSAVFRDHTTYAYSVCFGPDDRWLASAGWDGFINIYDVDSRRRIHQSPNLGRIWGIDCLRQQHAVAYASESGSVGLFHLDSGVEQLTKHDGRLYWLDVSPDDQWLGAGSSDHSAFLFNLKTRQEVSLVGSQKEVSRVAFGPGQLVATISEDTTVRLWNRQTAQPLWRVPVMVPSKAGVHFLTHRGWLTQDNTPPATLTSWQQAATDAVLADANPDHQHICLLLPAHLTIWNRRQDQMLAQFPLEKSDQIERLLALRSGCLLQYQNRAEIFPATGGTPQALPYGAGETLAVAQGSSGLFFAGSLRVDKVSAGEVTQSLPIGANVTAIAQMDQRLIAGFADGSLELVDLDGPRKKMDFSFQETPSSPVVSLVKGPMNTVAIGFANGGVGLWRLDNGLKLLDTKGHGPMTHVAIHKQQLVAVSLLADVVTLDLEPFYLPYCQLLQSLWTGTATVWKGGLPVVASPPVNHSCWRPQ